MKKIAILQSNYIPWKGYFDLIASVDEFIILDAVQFTKNDWRNRNKIKTRNSIEWLTIPVRQEKLEQKICEIKVSDTRWATKHWKTISQNYSKATYFHDYADFFSELYQKAATLSYLSDINVLFIKNICEVLGIKTKISSTDGYVLENDRIDRLIGLCKQSGADKYLSGPAAKAYMDEEKFAEVGIGLEWMDYTNYPIYEQIFPPFEHGVSIIDLLFNVGPFYKNYMKSI